MGDFVGRSRELHSLNAALARVRSGVGTATPGKMLLLRGRRRVGKSRLVEEFCAQSESANLFFAASRQGPAEPPLFVAEAVASDLPGSDLLAAGNPGTWDAALTLLARSLPDDSPTIVVIDEFPYLVEADPTIEATFQKQWDRLLSRKPILLILIGSDLAMMEALNTHGRAMFQRGTEMVLAPLSPSENARIVGAPDAAAAFDAIILTGGLPLISDEWPYGATVWDFLDSALSDATSALVVSAERSLAAELPHESQAAAVLRTIGAGEVTYSRVARAAGGLQAASLSRALDTLTVKRLVVRELPLSTRPSREARYRLTDPYLRFWLTFIGPHLPEIERGRGDRVLARIRRSWESWRGRAVEPIIREALLRMSPVDDRGPGLDHGVEAGDVIGTHAVGGYWTRSNRGEIDLIGADKGPVADRITFAGTIKWHTSQPLVQADLDRLATDAIAVPGWWEGLPLVAVSRSGATARGAAATLGPEDLLRAWE